MTPIPHKPAGVDKPTGADKPAGAEKPTICVLERHNFTEWRQRHSLGEAAGGLPYGLDALEERFVIAHPDHHFAGAAQRVLSSIEYRTDREVGQLLASLNSLRHSAACLSIFEDFGITYSMLRRAVRSLPCHLLMACWMSQRLLTFAHNQQDAYRRLAQRSEAVTVFSSNQVPILMNRLGLPRSKIHVIDFGVVTDFFCPSGEPTGDGYVAAVGQDVGRDWDTFFRAAALNPDLHFRLATWPGQVTGLDVPPNVQLLGALGPRAYRSLVQRADLVVVATHPLSYPTGQSVLLEALACGRPVVAARSAALREYVNHEGAVTYEAGDSADLALRTAELVRDGDRRREMAVAARNVALARFDSRSMWSQVADVLSAII